MSNPSGRHGTGPGKKQLSGLGGIVPCTGKGGGSSKNQSSKNYMSSQNWTGKKGSQDITIFDTKILVKDVCEEIIPSSELQRLFDSLYSLMGRWRGFLMQVLQIL